MIRDICPQNIDNLEIKVLNYSQRFNLRGLISKLLSKNTNSESLLVTLTNAKKHIQLVFSISLT